MKQISVYQLRQNATSMIGTLLSSEEALMELQDAAGSQFDPMVVESLSTVAKICNNPKQGKAIHTIVGKQPGAATIARKLNQTNQDKNRCFPERVGRGQAPSAATATPSLHPCRIQA